MTGGFHIVSTPIGGTFTTHYRHGKSDPVAYNAGAELVNKAVALARERDAAITAEHQADPELAYCCDICNPPKLPAAVGFVYPAPRWWHELGWRLRMAWDVLRHGEDAL